VVQVGWQHFDEQFKGTVAGAVNAVQAVLPAMEEQGYGKIINVGTNLVYNPVVPYYDYTGARPFPHLSRPLHPHPYALRPKPSTTAPVGVCARPRVGLPSAATHSRFMRCGLAVTRSLQRRAHQHHPFYTL